MKNLATTKVSKIVASNYQTAKVFTHHGIDFCCNGGIALEDACRNKGLDIEEVLRQIEWTLQEPDAVDFQSMTLPELIGHIVNVHHNYVEATIPVLEAYLTKLSAVHGDRHPELHQIKALFHETAGALTTHMKKEEFILFPYINAMCNARDSQYPLSEPHFGHIDNPIAMMEHEHTVEGDRFREMATLSNQYTAPADGCQTYRVAFAVLDEFEKDLHKHIHLENNILFPKAKELYADRMQPALN